MRGWEWGVVGGGVRLIGGEKVLQAEIRGMLQRNEKIARVTHLDPEPFRAN